MGLFDLFRRSAPQPESQPRVEPEEPLGTGLHRFERDPSRKFDPARTASLARLLEVPSGQRDPDWVMRFWDAAWTAALAVPEPPVITGPDGFPYLRLNLPGDGASYEANSLMNIAQSMVDQGVGAAIFPSAEAPIGGNEFAIPMGVLDSILRFDHPDGEPSELEEKRRGSPVSGEVTLKAGEQILIGTPSAEYLSTAAARAVHRHLSEDWGLADPRVGLLDSGSMCPSRSLIIGHSHSDLIARGATDAQIAGWMQRIGWYLPPSRSLTLMPDDWDLRELTPLSQLF